jgi:hypothetical protein
MFLIENKNKHYIEKDINKMIKIVNKFEDISIYLKEFKINKKKL